jgi:tight adherence protein C
MNISQWIIVLGLSLVALFILVWLRSLTPNLGQKYINRIGEIDEEEKKSKGPSLTELELSRPLFERVFSPLKSKIIHFITSRTPTARKEKLQLQISNAGRPMGATVSEVLAVQTIFALLFVWLGIAFFAPFVGLQFPVNLLGALAGLVGWTLPELGLLYLGKRRANQIYRQIPTTLDLLAICMDAGLNLDAALHRIGDKIGGPLRQEMRQFFTEQQLGSSRNDALLSMAKRIDIEDWTVFVREIIRATALGVPIAQMIRISAEDMRRLRRQAAEEKAAQAPLKMLFPMIFFIFPTLFIVLIGPVVLILLNRH